MKTGERGRILVSVDVYFFDMWRKCGKLSG